MNLKLKDIFRGKVVNKAHTINTGVDKGCISFGCIQNELGCRDLSGFETRRSGSSLTFGNLTGLRGAFKMSWDVETCQVSRRADPVVH
jgi:hypothetical protein